MSPVIEVSDIHTRFGAQVVHAGVNFSVERGTVAALIGGSGTGKTVLLREIIGLLRPCSGSVRLFGENVHALDGDGLAALRRRFGVLFQDGALFSSLSIADNVAAPLREHTGLPARLIREVTASRLMLANLPLEALPKMPAQLSGGMRKRAALARALALEPELLFLDEPTSGLDPIAAREFDRTIRTLADSLGLTVLLTTHDLDTLWSIVDRVIVLGEGRVIADGPVPVAARAPHPWVESYFSAHADWRKDVSQ